MSKKMYRTVCAAVFVVLLCVGVLGQTATNQTTRKEGELWFEPIKTEIGGQTVEGELGRLIVKENRKAEKSNLIELAFVRLKSTAEKPGYPVI